MNTQNNNALAERAPFLMPDVVTTTDFSQEELAEDMDGLNIGFRRIKIPSGGQLQFEIPTEDPDNPNYAKKLEGVIVYSHNANAYWMDGQNDGENAPPDCQSMDGKLGVGCPGGLCASCGYNVFGSGPNNKGKACKNMRVIYLLQSGTIMPIQISLPPTSIRPYTDFVNASFMSRHRGVCGSVVEISLKKANNGKDDYSVAVFKRLYDFSGEELAKIRAYANSFKEQVKLILNQQAAMRETGSGSEIEVGAVHTMPENAGHFAVGATVGAAAGARVVSGEREDLPL